MCTHSDGPQHNCAYVDWRNGFIPAAEQWANVEWGDKYVGSTSDLMAMGTYRLRWGTAFLYAMDRMVSGKLLPIKGELVGKPACTT